MRILAAAALLASTLASAQPADRLAWLGWLKDLAGNCWLGNDATGRSTDLQCYEIQFGHYLRGTIAIGAAGNSSTGLHGDSVFHRDPASGRIAFITWASNGVVGRGEALLDGEAIRFPQPREEGKPELRTSWSRLGPDAFRVVRERRDGAAWIELLAVTYHKVAP